MSVEGLAPTRESSAQQLAKCSHIDQAWSRSPLFNSPFSTFLTHPCGQALGMGHLT